MVACDQNKNFSHKNTKAMLWSKCIEGDVEMVEALNLRGAAIKFTMLAEAYLEQWAGRDRSWPSKVKWW